MNAPINDGALDQLFRQARTFNNWLDKPVTNTMLGALYDLLKFGPTAANCSPLRLVFLRSKEAKEKLRPLLIETNIDKVMSAPVTVLLAVEMEFVKDLPILFPHIDAKSWFEGNEKLTMETAWRNATLQAGYFIMAARSLGFDCGPMSGFDNDKVNELFFAGSSLKVNFICNLGYGDDKDMHSRLPRLSFEEVCKID